MWYAWKKEMGSEWKLVYSTESEEEIKAKEAELRRNQGGSRLAAWASGAVFKITDYELSDEEKKK
jgi:hypothetical protein